MAVTDPPARAASWLASDLVEWIDEVLRAGPAALDDEGHHFDVVIVGSGYGGGIVLEELAGYARPGAPHGAPLRIALLERGNEYLPGAFPSRLADLPGHLRYSSPDSPAVGGRATGLFDLRLGPDMGVVLANGLGGGSLINAGVMAAPLPEVFEDPRWPAALRADPGLGAALGAMQSHLGAQAAPVLGGRLAALDGLAPSAAAPITVALSDAGDLRACNQCGDCATGCNFGAKRSIDVGPIANARRRHDARRLRVITGATARSFRPSGEGWRLQVEHTDPSLRDRAQVRCDISTRLLIVCAGTFGSTELLLRARADGLEGLSPTLGTGFSGNGDHLVLLDGTPQPVRAVADEEQAFGARAVGPTITRSLDLRRDPEQACVIQDLAIPGPLRRLFEEVAAYTGMMDRLMRVDRQTYGPNENPPDPNGRCPSAVDHALVLAVIGRDDSAGRLDLPSDGADAEVGTLTVRWPGAGTDPGIDALLERVARLAGAGAAAPDRPTPVLHANPLWRPLPGPVENMLGAARGPLVSVHPLGGCRMGDTVHHGVVDHLGRVFRGDQTDTFAGLVVLDGSIIPVCLGINPALTIATLARRAIRRLRDHHWRFQPAVAGPAPAVDATWPPRPVFRPMPDAQAINPTRFEITERMQARARIAHAGRRTEALVTVELWFRPFTLADVAGRAAERRLEVDPARSRLRVVTWADASEPDASASGKLLLEAPLSGSMQLFAHEASGRWRRTLRASLAWLRNRAVRDLFTGDSLRSLVSGELRDWIPQTLNLASRAGDRRLLRYELEIGAPASGLLLDDPAAWTGRRIRATKTLTYAVACNPAGQLLEARIDAFPRSRALRVRGPFRVDLPYFGQVAVPLLRIVEQHDHVRGLVDMASLLAYFGRTIVPLHAWSFRLPDRPRLPLPKDPRLPRRLPGLPPPRIVWLPMSDGRPVRLTHYAPPAGVMARPDPVLALHGYSASGTNFAHEALPEGGLAGALCRRGHHVWVADLRSSAGLESSREPWTFEMIGCQDIPMAVAYVHGQHSGQVHVVAHCMGAAMLSLGLFRRWPGDPAFTPHAAACRAMPERMGRLVLSQVGPAVTMSPANLARAYVFQWLKNYPGFGAISFRPSAVPGTAEDMLDRLLCAVPYPRSDFFRENPLWPPWKRTPWVAQRHRMDALYGITFEVQGMSDQVLERIDEFFGPSHMATTAQVIWFARSRLITDMQGRGAFMTPDRMSALRHRPVLSLHAERNGLVDPDTQRTLTELLRQAGAAVRAVSLPGGHQDSLIGRDAARVFAEIAEFLETPADNPAAPHPPTESSHEHAGV